MSGDFYYIQFPASEQVARDVLEEAGILQDIHQQLRIGIQNLYATGLSGAFLDELDSRQRFLSDTLAQYAAEVDESGQDLLTVVQRSRELDAECAALFEALLIRPQSMQARANVWDWDLLGFLGAPTIDEGIDYLNDTETGRSLLAECRGNGLAFRLPNGALIGAENPTRVVPISFGDAGGNIGVYDPQQKSIVVVDGLIARATRRILAGVLAHEMQHALDDQVGVMFIGVPAFPQNFTELSPDEQATLIEMTVDALIAEEVRAFEREAAVIEGRAYADDGVLTGEERRNIMYGRSYQLKFEDDLNDWYRREFGAGYEIDLYVDDQGNVQAWFEKMPEK